MEVIADLVPGGKASRRSPFFLAGRNKEKYWK
jgi:hypothetical protein